MGQHPGRVVTCDAAVAAWLIGIRVRLTGTDVLPSAVSSRRAQQSFQSEWRTRAAASAAVDLTNLFLNPQKASAINVWQVLLLLCANCVRDSVRACGRLLIVPSRLTCRKRTIWRRFRTAHVIGPTHFMAWRMRIKTMAYI